MDDAVKSYSAWAFEILFRQMIESALIICWKNPRRKLQISTE